MAAPLAKPDKISWHQTPVHTLEIVGQTHFVTKQKRIFTLTFKEQRPALNNKRVHSPIIHGHPPCWGSLAQQGYWVYWCWDVSPYQNIHNSLAPLRVLNPFDPCFVPDWGSHWEMMVGMVLNNRVRCWWDPPPNTEDIIWKVSQVNREQDCWGNPKAVGLLQQSQ